MKFILHRQDTQFFCRVIMGEFDYHVGQIFGSDATHTLDLHYSPTYGQHESNNVFETQTLLLQKYRSTLRDLTRSSIRGASLGWENGLYGAVLHEIRSIDDREPTELPDDIRTLVHQGSQILLQTGDVKAAVLFWAKALGKFCVAHLSLFYSAIPDFFHYHWSNAFKWHMKRWIQLRRKNGDDCAIPFIELLYKLTSHRLSGVIRVIEQSHHLATTHGRAPRPRGDYLNFFYSRCSDLFSIRRHFHDTSSWSPQPPEHARMCLTLAASTAFSTRRIQLKDHTS